MSSIKYQVSSARTLDFQIERLAKRLLPLEQRSNQIALLRLTIVLIGIVAAILTAIFFNGTLAWFIVALSFLVFSLLVLVHRRQDNWIETLTRLRAQKQDQRARLLLDWENIPAPRPIELLAERKSLARDLDLTGYNSLHQLLDTTVSRHGTQLLAEWLTQSRPDVNALHARQNIVRELKTRARFRERFWLTYRRVLQRELEGDNLLDWLRTEFPSARLRWTLPIAAILVFINLVLFALAQVWNVPAYYIFSFLAYVAFYFWNKDHREAVLNAVVRLNTELEKFRALAQYLERASYHDAPHLAELVSLFQNKTPAPSEQLRVVQWITAAVGLRSNPLFAVFLNLILPWDFLFAFLADRQRARVAQTLPEWVRVVHELDALIALGNFAALHPAAAFPEIRAREFSAPASPILRAEKLGHPLIPARARITNDFEIQNLGQVEILTGSNMSGKSTFLKTIGINFCLAYAGAPVIAANFVAQPFRLRTCIRITDSIADGFSYFYAEVKCLKELLRELGAPEELPLFYLIDEIFRGTNNRERLIGSRAYIYTLLGANGAGLIATHDLELAHIPEKNPLARNFHFRDDVSEGRLVFDYTLRAGPSPTTNALRIMELEGLPIT